MFLHCHFFQLKTGVDNIPFLTILANVLVGFCIFFNTVCKFDFIFKNIFY